MRHITALMKNGRWKFNFRPNLKLVSAISIQFLFFHQMIALQKLKNAFYFI